jgi:hypothetical protein
MTDSNFNSADFLDHHWFQNALHLFRANPSGLENEEFPPYTIKSLDNKTVVERIASCHVSGKLSEAMPDVPDDIMLFLSRYIFPTEQLAENLSKVDFFKYYEPVHVCLTELMEKYGANLNFYSLINRAFFCPKGPAVG